MKLLEAITGGYSSSAKVVGEALVLSLPDAQSPIVWRMDLADIKAAAFEIREQDNIYLLVMKKPKGEEQEIAPFENKAKALRALMAASYAMEQAGKGTTAANDMSAAAAQTKNKNHFAAGIIGIVLLALLIFGLIQVSPKKTGSLSAVSSTQTASGQSAAGQPGVPVSADDFLRTR